MNKFSKTILLILGVMFCCCMDVWNQIPFLWRTERGGVTSYYYLFNSYVFGGQYLPFFALALSTVLGTVNYCKEYLSGVDKYVIQRLGSVKAYAVSKVWVSILTCNVTYLFGMIIFVLFTLCFQPFYDLALNVESEGLPYYHYLNVKSGLSYLGVILYLALIRTTLWNLVTLWISAYVKNVYVTIATPILAAYTFSRILTMLRLEPDLRPDYWLSGRSVLVSDKITLLACTFFVLFICVLCIVGFVRKVKYDEENR